MALAGETQGRRLGATSALVGRWERDAQQPGYRYGELLCTLFRARLSPWESDPRVRELDDQLAAILPWCPPATA